MRNKFKTCRKKSNKPMSRKKRGRLNEELFLAEIALTNWFNNYMNNLRGNDSVK